MPQTTYMTLADAAKALNTPLLNVTRAIARRRLHAAQLGPDGEWRVSGPELDWYIGAGAPDFIMPPIEDGWFAPNADVPANAFHSAFLQAAKMNLPAARPNEVEPIIVPMSEMMKTAVELPAAGTKGPQTFADAATAYFVARARHLAKDAIVTGPRAALATLYASPDAYEGFATRVIGTILAGRILFAKNYGNPGSGENVQFCVPHTELLPQARRLAVMAAAF